MENNEIIDNAKEANKYLNEVMSKVKLSDWTKLISYGVGNSWYLVMIAWSIIYSAIQAYLIFVLSNWIIMNKHNQQNSNDFYLYLGLIFASVVVMWLASIVNFAVFTSSSKNLHSKMVYKLLRAPLHFFDSNSIGTIVTRFSKDIQTLSKFL